MTAAREAFALPAIFLSVTLLGGMRVADTVRLIPPSLVALVLGMVLLASLARAGVLLPELLMNNRRTGLENVCGLIVLLSLFAASAQVFNLVTPDSGLLHAVFSLFFLVQLLTTFTAVRERVALLRGLLVLLGAAFLIRFVLLESLYSPGGGLVKRLTTTLMEGVTLGALEYSPHAAATGYIAFVTLTLYMIGLVLLAPPSLSPSYDGGESERLPAAPRRELLVLLLTGAVYGASAGIGPWPSSANDRFAAPTDHHLDLPTSGLAPPPRNPALAYVRE